MLERCSCEAVDMRIGMVDLIARTADVQAYIGMVGNTIQRPATDQDLSTVRTGRSLVKEGHEVTIFMADAYRPLRTGDLGGVKIEYIPTRSPRLFSPSIVPYAPTLRHDINRVRLDVVQSTELFQPGTLLSWSATRDKELDMYIWQERDGHIQGPMGWVQRGFYRTVGRTVIRDSRRVIPRSRSAAAHLREAGVPDEKIAPVVHTGADTDVHRPQNKEDARARFGIDEDQNVLLAIGCLHKNRGMDLMLRAMSFLKVGDPDCLLILKGTGQQERELRDMVVCLGLEGNVRFMTERLEQGGMAALYNSADMLLSASRTDLFPLSAIEAISCGVPIATSFSQALKSDIVDEGAGAMLPTEPQAMATRLRELLDDTVRLDLIGAKARELALREFSFEVGAKRLLEIYSGN